MTHEKMEQVAYEVIKNKMNEAESVSSEYMYGIMDYEKALSVADMLEKRDQEVEQYNEKDIDPDSIKQFYSNVVTRINNVLIATAPVSDTNKEYRSGMCKVIDLMTNEMKDLGIE